MMRLKEAREKAGYSQKQVALMLGIKGPSVSNWERGKTSPTHENLVRLAALYHVSMDYIVGHDTEPEPSSQAVRIPVLGTIPAGVPIEAIEDILDWEEIPADWTRGGKEYFALRVTGSSMYPEYRDGDVIVLRKQETCETGQDCAVMVNGDDATFKRVKWSERGVMLQAINPDYESYIFTHAEWAEKNGRILGVVVELRRKI